MTGLAMLLKSFGINIDPEQVSRDYDQLKKDIAVWGALVVEMKQQMDRIENRLNANLSTERDNSNG